MFTFHHWYTLMIIFVNILFFHSSLSSINLFSWYYIKRQFIIFFIFMIHFFVLYFIWYRLSSSVLPRVCVSSIIYINDIYLLSFLQLLIFFSFCISSSPSSPLLVVRVSCSFTGWLGSWKLFHAMDVGCRPRIVLSVVVRVSCYFTCWLALGNL